MDKKFEILKWDSLKDNYDMVKPIFYFRPNMEFIIHCKNNKNKIKIDVQSDNYNLKNIDADIDKLNEFSVLPNLSSQDVVYVAVLNTPFTVIDNKGTFNITKPTENKSHNVVVPEVDLPQVDVSGVDMSNVNTAAPEVTPEVTPQNEVDDEDIKESYNIFTKFSLNTIILMVVCVFFVFYFTLLTISEFDSNFNNRKTFYYTILTGIFTLLIGLYCFLK